MLRRRYYAEKEAAGKTKRRQKAYATVRYRSSTKRSVYRCAEDGFLTEYSPFSEDDFPYSPDECLCFTGHRSLSIKDIQIIGLKLPELLKKFYLQGKKVFLSGGALGFDTLAAQEVLALRKKYQDVKLVLAVPCESQSSRWSPEDQQKYLRLLKAADDIQMVSKDYFPGCMQKRNRYLVNHSDTCICYMTHCRGGTWNTVSYAYDRHRRIINLAER